ncbi:hypothetical protein VP249E411_P0029 [Vibrio phage 249E41-1]|nr:hypothetical protein VP249E411_P0029 [Vibrio phage 249E41-1]CAH9012217.1 hypothetical protein VP495E541_P0033 [Vibrio phage 495E54-1]CAH9012297.1 hypothetical protein VP496E541_P0033 [Vibrio phage 496E54-1]
MYIDEYLTSSMIVCYRHGECIVTDGNGGGYIIYGSSGADKMYHTLMNHDKVSKNNKANMEGFDVMWIFDGKGKCIQGMKEFCKNPRLDSSCVLYLRKM